MCHEDIEISVAGPLEENTKNSKKGKSGLTSEQNRYYTTFRNKSDGMAISRLFITTTKKQVVVRILENGEATHGRGG